MPRLRPTRRVVALAIAGLALAGLSSAAASQLSVNGGTLQAGVGAVADCQPSGQAIAVSFASSFSNGAYRATSMTISDVAPACQGAAYRVQLLTAAGVAIDMDGASASTDVGGVVALSNGAFTVSFPSTTVSSIGRVALVMTK